MRVKSLDSVRGLASLVVVFSHCYLVSPPQADFATAMTAPEPWTHLWTWMSYTPLSALVNGRAAVILFFILSGMVLSFPFLVGKQMSYGRYAVRRVCRIYLPFAFAIFLAAALYAVVDPSPIPALGNWFNNKSWTAAPSWPVLAAHLLMTGRPGDIGLDNVMWSLVHELRISLIFPLLMFFALRSWRALFLVTVNVSSIAFVVVWLFPLPPLWRTALETVYYVVFFVVGIGLAMHSTALKQLTANLGPMRIAGLLVASMLAWTVPAEYAGAEYLYAAASVTVFCLALGVERAGEVLGRSPLVWLGRVSYSLYLIHVPIQLALLHCFYGTVPPWLILPMAVATSLAGAELVYRAVEAASIRLGQYLSAKPRRAHVAKAGLARHMLQPVE